MRVRVRAAPSAGWVLEIAPATSSSNCRGASSSIDPKTAGSASDNAATSPVNGPMYDPAHRSNAAITRSANGRSESPSCWAIKPMSRSSACSMASRNRAGLDSKRKYKPGLDMCAAFATSSIDVFRYPNRENVSSADSRTDRRRVVSPLACVSKSFGGIREVYLDELYVPSILRIVHV